MVPDPVILPRIGAWGRVLIDRAFRSWAAETAGVPSLGMAVARAERAERPRRVRSGDLDAREFGPALASRSRGWPPMLQVTLAGLHLLALPLGLGAVVVRAAALRAGPDATALRRALRADALWGAAALLWLGTGLWRWLGGVEMPAELYTRNPLLHVKLGLFAGVFALEIRPMITLLRCRRALAAGAAAVDLLEPRAARRIARISAVQAVVVVAIVFVAAALARGYGLVG